MTVDAVPAVPTKEEVRKRIVEEDTLLGARTTVFLTSNGFFLTAVSVTDLPLFRVTICILGIVIAAIWLTTTTQIWRVITSLHELYQQHYANDVINATVFKAIHWKKTFGETIFGPTELISLWLPGIILVGWMFIGSVLILVRLQLISPSSITAPPVVHASAPALSASRPQLHLPR